MLNRYYSTTLSHRLINVCLSCLAHLILFFGLNAIPYDVKLPRVNRSVTQGGGGGPNHISVRIVNMNQLNNLQARIKAKNTPRKVGGKIYTAKMTDKPFKYSQDRNITVSKGVQPLAGGGAPASGSQQVASLATPPPRAALKTVPRKEFKRTTRAIQKRAPLAQTKKKVVEKAKTVGKAKGSKLGHKAVKAVQAAARPPKAVEVPKKLPPPAPSMPRPVAPPPAKLAKIRKVSSALEKIKRLLKAQAVKQLSLPKPLQGQKDVTLPDLVRRASIIKPNPVAPKTAMAVPKFSADKAPKSPQSRRLAAKAPKTSSLESRTPKTFRRAALTKSSSVRRTSSSVLNRINNKVAEFKAKTIRARRSATTGQKGLETGLLRNAILPQTSGSKVIHVAKKGAAVSALGGFGKSKKNISPRKPSKKAVKKSSLAKSFGLQRRALSNQAPLLRRAELKTRTSRDKDRQSNVQDKIKRFTDLQKRESLDTLTKKRSRPQRRTPPKLNIGEKLRKLAALNGLAPEKLQRDMPLSKMNNKLKKSTYMGREAKKAPITGPSAVTGTKKTTDALAKIRRMLDKKLGAKKLEMVKRIKLNKKSAPSKLTPKEAASAVAKLDRQELRKIKRATRETERFDSTYMPMTTLAKLKPNLESGPLVLETNETKRRLDINLFSDRSNKQIGKRDMDTRGLGGKQKMTALILRNIDRTPNVTQNTPLTKTMKQIPQRARKRKKAPVTRPAKATKVVAISKRAGMQRRRDTAPPGVQLASAAVMPTMDMTTDTMTMPEMVDLPAGASSGELVASTRAQPKLFDVAISKPDLSNIDGGKQQEKSMADEKKERPSMMDALTVNRKVSLGQKVSAMFGVLKGRDISSMSGTGAKSGPSALSKAISRRAATGRSSFAKMQYVDHNADKTLELGDVLEVVIKGDSGADIYATFDIGLFRTDIEMDEREPGLYVGHYRVQEGDNISEAIVTGYLTNRDGNQTSDVARKLINIDTSPGVTISSPRNGASTDKRTQVVTGITDDLLVKNAIISVNGNLQTVPVENGFFSHEVVLAKGANDIEVMVMDSRGNVGKHKIAVMYVAYHLGPKITIDYPKDGADIDTSDSNIVHIRARVENTDVSECKLILNDMSYNVAVDSNGFIEQPVVLFSPMSSFVIEATDSKGTGISPPITVKSSGEFAGEVIISLTWDSPNADLDLVVSNEDGQFISHRSKSLKANPNAIPGAELEIDDKGGYGPEVFKMKGAPPGLYTVSVNCFGLNGDDQTNASLTVYLAGKDGNSSKLRTFGPHTFTDRSDWRVTFVGMPEMDFYVPE